MSRLTAFLIVSIISFQAFYNAGVLTYWLANRAYISSVLCENRSRPAMHCDGKCYLKKNLTATGNVRQLPTLHKGLELAECLSRVTLPSFIFIVLESGVSLPSNGGHCATGFPHGVFHPPSCQA